MDLQTCPDLHGCVCVSLGRRMSGGLLGSWAQVQASAPQQLPAAGLAPLSDSPDLCDDAALVEHPRSALQDTSLLYGRSAPLQDGEHQNRSVVTGQ